MLSILILAATLVAAREADCNPRPEMYEIAKKRGYELYELKSGVKGSEVKENAFRVCGDVNGDDRVDLCTILVGGKGQWQAGCFVSRRWSYRFEIFESSELPQGATPRALEGYYLSVAKAGETVRWADGAADIKLVRDCVEFGVSKSASRLYCYNGAYFLSMQLSD